MELEKIVTDFLKKEHLTDKKLLCMVSGGVDSVVLLNILNKIFDQKSLAVFHLDHSSRNNSDKDFQFVQNLCSKFGTKFYGEKLDKIPQKDKENFWRTERKRLAKKAKKDFGAERILTAHHATDLVETMLFRLTKGCGIDGLSPFETSTKPLWQVPKSEIEKYARENKLKWIEDPSNENTDFQRNLIRKEVLPHLRKITPNLEQVFVREAEIFGEMADFLDKSVETVGTSRDLSLPDFLNLPKILQKEWLQKIAKSTPSASEIEDCLRWLHGNPPGKSKKEIGGTKLQIVNNKIQILPC